MEMIMDRVRNRWLLLSAFWLSSFSMMTFLSADIIRQSDVKVDAFGNAVAMWVKDSDDVRSIQTTTLPFGSSSWTAITDVSMLGMNAINPVLAMNAAGNAVLMWMAKDPKLEGMSLYSATLVSGATDWSSTMRVSDDSFDVYSFSVRINEKDTVFAAWSGVSKGVHMVSAANATFGGSWSAPIEISHS
jgi:hypothetical protein